MPRPPAVPNDAIVDADVCARAGTLIERSFRDSELARLHEAGGQAGSALALRLQFVQVDGQPAIDGELTGTIVATCQRCMKSVSIPLSERFQVIIVGVERADDVGGYEPVVADASRLDLRWLAEEQALLAMPLVPLHESETCADAQTSAPESDEDEGVRQKPFQNLRDMLRQH